MCAFVCVCVWLCPGYVYQEMASKEAVEKVKCLKHLFLKVRIMEMIE